MKGMKKISMAEKEEYEKDISEQCSDILKLLALREKRLNKEFTEKMLKELELLYKIKTLVDKDITRRAYYCGLQAKVEKAILPLKNGTICAGRGNSELMKIKKDLDVVIHIQKGREKEFLSKVRWQIGELMWNRLRNEFESDTFLNRVYVRDNSALNE